MKYLPYILCVVLFFAGRLSSPDRSKEVEKKYKEEQEIILKAKALGDVKIADLIKAQERVERERVQDSLRFASALEANQRAYNALKRKYNEINLSRATVRQLDSAVSVLYGHP